MENSSTLSLPTDSKTETLSEDLDSAFLKELGIDLETREKTLATLESMFGDRIFHRDDDHGTVREMYISCPAFGDILEQGAPSAAAWLEANDQPQTEKGDDGEKEPETPEEALVKDRESAINQGMQSVKESARSEKPSQTKTKKESAVGTKSEAAHLNEAPVITQKDTGVAAKAPSIRSDKSEQTSQSPTIKTIESPAAETKVLGIKVTTPEASLLARAQSAGEVNKLKNTKADDVFSRPGIEKYPEEQVEISRKAVSEMPIYEVGMVTQVSQEFQPILSEETYLPRNEVTVKPDVTLEITKNTDPERIETIPVDRGVERYGEETMFDENNEDLEPLTPNSDVLDTYSVLDHLVETTSEPEISEQPTDNEVLGAEIISNVMLNEIAEITSEGSGEYQEIVQAPVELETLPTEVLEILKEFIPETPELPIELSEEYATGLIRQASSIIEVIEVLEKSKTAEECREALKFVRIELASLLRLLGYENSEQLADNLVKEYGMLTLKKYIALLKKPLIVADKVDASKLKSIATLKLPRHFGTHAVRTLVTLTLDISSAQAA